MYCCRSFCHFCSFQYLKVALIFDGSDNFHVRYIMERTFTHAALRHLTTGECTTMTRSSANLKISLRSISEKQYSSFKIPFLSGSQSINMMRTYIIASMRNIVVLSILVNEKLQCHSFRRGFISFPD